MCVAYRDFIVALWSLLSQYFEKPSPEAFSLLLFALNTPNFPWALFCILTASNIRPLARLLIRLVNDHGPPIGLRYLLASPFFQQNERNAHVPRESLLYIWMLFSWGPRCITDLLLVDESVAHVVGDRLRCLSLFAWKVRPSAYCPMSLDICRPLYTLSGLQHDQRVQRHLLVKHSNSNLERLVDPNRRTSTLL